MLINFVGVWISLLYYLVIELSVMNDVFESIFLKVNEIEENNREFLNDFRWIFIKVRNFLVVIFIYKRGELCKFNKKDILKCIIFL